MDELKNYLKLYSRWKEIKKDAYSIKFLKKEDLENHLKEIEEYEREVVEGEIYENEKRILLGLVRDYRKGLKNEKGFLEDLDAIEILFFLSSFGAAGVLYLALERYFEKVYK
ncbi:MAG: hypothetical protein QXP77_01895 [Candidatus Aenigmatarchaeota archaeon]